MLTISPADPRFANIHSDPRFRLPSKKHNKTKLDARFAHMLKDKEFSQKASVDRYGRKLGKDAGKKELERFYRVEDEEESDEADIKQDKGRDKAVRKELARVEGKKRDYDPIREGGFSSSSSEESSSESDEEDEEEDPQVEDETELPEERADVPMGEVTTRLAAVNMDWDNIRAMDIMAVASSFVSAENKILSVTVYPSEFGRQRLEREEIEGPPREIFASSSKTDLDRLASASPSQSDTEDEVDDEQIKKDLLKESNGEEFDSKALRAYQLDRLRYYYAVICCSSPEAAKSIYDSLDGREYLSSANFFDLRFVPDDVTFDDEPHDLCEKLPDAYRPNEFTTDALTHSKVKLTWDAEDTTRKEVQKRAFSRKEIDENDLQAYLGSDSSSSEDEEENKKSKKAASLRAALGLSDSKTVSTKSTSAKLDRDFKKPEGDMQITFTAGLSTSDGKKSVFENEPIIQETTAEKYVRQQKERKARRKERAKAIREGRDPDAEEAEAASASKPGEADEDKGDDDDPWNDPFFNEEPAAALKSSKSQLKKLKKEKDKEELEKRKAESDAQRAELELLMLDDKVSNIRHFDMNEIMKAEKAKKRKGKNKKTKADDTPAVEDNFEMDVKDPRFTKLFESHEFAIDPTNPRFKGTEGMKALLEEGRKKRKHERADEGGDTHETTKKKRKEKEEGTAEELDDLKKLAARVKARSKKVSS